MNKFVALDVDAAVGLVRVDVERASEIRGNAVLLGYFAVIDKLVLLCDIQYSDQLFKMVESNAQ